MLKKLFFKIIELVRSIFTPSEPVRPNKKDLVKPNKPSEIENASDPYRKQVQKLFYPRSKWFPHDKLLKGFYKFEYNEKYAVCVHFVANRYNWPAKAFFEYMRSSSYNTSYIDGKGQVWQQHHGYYCGWHTGKGLKSAYEKFRHKFQGIEIAIPGKVTKISDNSFKTWYGEILTRDQVRYVSANDGYQISGWFAKALPCQEDELALYLAWYIRMGIPAENLFTHAEIAAPHGHKNDTSGSLSLPFDKFVQQKVLPLV